MGLWLVYISIYIYIYKIAEAERKWIPTDDAKNNTSKSHGPRTLLMAPAQQQQETILVEGTGVVPAKCSPKIKSELFSLL